MNLKNEVERTSLNTSNLVVIKNNINILMKESLNTEASSFSNVPKCLDNVKKHYRKIATISIEQKYGPKDGYSSKTDIITLPIEFIPSILFLEIEYNLSKCFIKNGERADFIDTGGGGDGVYITANIEGKNIKLHIAAKDNGNPKVLLKNVTAIS